MEVGIWSCGHQRARGKHHWGVLIVGDLQDFQIDPILDNCMSSSTLQNSPLVLDTRNDGCMPTPLHVMSESQSVSKRYHRPTRYRL